MIRAGVLTLQMADGHQLVSDGTPDADVRIECDAATPGPYRVEIGVGHNVFVTVADDVRGSAAIDLLAGDPLPLVADVREKSTGKQSGHPAFLLPASGDAIPSTVILPAGLPARALAIRFLVARDQSLLSIRLDGMLERGSDNERWSLSEG